MKTILFLKDSSGSIAVSTVILMVVFVGLMAIVIDLGHVFTVQNELRNAADACALRGARAFYADDEAALSENSVERESANIPQAAALETVGMNYTDSAATALKNLANVATGVWNYEAKPAGWLGGSPDFSLWDPVNNKDLYGKIVGPGIRLNVNRVGTENSGPVSMSLARIFNIPSVDVTTEATAALRPAGKVGPDDWDKTGVPPPIRIGDEEASDPTLRTFTLYPNTTQAGGWHSYDIANPNVPTLENLVWGKDQKTGEPITVPELTAGQSSINLQNGVDSKMFLVPDPSKPNDPNQLSLLSRWLLETGRTVIDPNAPTYTDPTKDWVVWLPVTDSDQTTGESKVLGFVRVAIDWVDPPPDKTIKIRILEPYVAPPGIPGGGAYFGIMALDPKIVK
jgi:Putative Flp pilus-assembly TadE/G-like